MGNMRLMVVAMLLTLSILASDHQAYGDTALADTTWGLVNVQCFAYAGTEVQYNYGVWLMQEYALSSMAFSAIDSNTSEISCHFNSLENGSHQWFPVYSSTGLSINCGSNCMWTVADNGFFLHDPEKNTDVFVYGWQTGDDNWVPPV